MGRGGRISSSRGRLASSAASGRVTETGEDVGALQDGVRSEAGGGFSRAASVAPSMSVGGYARAASEDGGSRPVVRLRHPKSRPSTNYMEGLRGMP
jgi:hypothetical protein